jgi:aminopeptidase N
MAYLPSDIGARHLARVGESSDDAIMRPRLLIFLLCLAAIVTARDARAQRLPSTVTPEHYDLAFDVDVAAAAFRGTEAIRVRLAEPARRIVLHALDLRIEDVTIAAGGVTQPAGVSFDTAAQTATLTVPREIAAGSAEIHLTFSAPLNRNLRGFYLSRANGRNYAVTQFESTDARRAFPCFDEPAFKATFSVTLTIDAKDTAISNGRLLSDTPGPGANRHTLTFAESPKMSSYLVAMAVGDFACLEGASGGVPIRICATPDKKDLGHIALDAVERILTFYNRYYSIAYPFGKLDVVAVPDFAAGAMENTAAIFYREATLLADPATASVADRKRIWEVLAHEMAHQWFGDLVTMQWWDDLWLNEGFATWMEKQPLAALQPTWDMDVDAAHDAETALALDSLASTRPIHAAVSSTAAIEESFDAIAYEKGGSVMRMVEGYLGPDAFRAGVNAYLEAHRYGNATSADFWTAVARSSGRPVDRVMPTFVNRPGAPLVDVSLACRGPSATLNLRQERLTATADRLPAGEPWVIPFTVRTPGGGSGTFSLLDGPTMAAPVATSTAGPSSTPACPAWVFINQDARGYFRTAYPPAMVRALAPDVETRLTPPERLAFAADEWALVKAGRHTVGDFLTLASGYGRESVGGVLDQVALSLAFIHDHLTTDATRPEYEQFVRRLFRPLFDDLGVDAAPGEPDDRRALRAAVIDVLGTVGRDPGVAAEARRALDRSMAGQRALDPTAATAIITVASGQGDAALFAALVSAAGRAVSPAERNRDLYALANFEDRALVERGLSLALASDMRAQDAASFVARFLMNPAINAQAWAFVKDHWDVLGPKVAVFFGTGRVIASLNSFCDAPARDDIRAFFTAHPAADAARTLDQTIERIDACTALRAKAQPAVAAWLAR